MLMSPVLCFDNLHVKFKANAKEETVAVSRYTENGKIRKPSHTNTVRAHVKGETVHKPRATAQMTLSIFRMMFTIWSDFSAHLMQNKVRNSESESE